MEEHLFTGLKVIDAATVIAAPAAAMMLADFGAEVVKIERPGGGDMLRHLSNMPSTVPGAENYMWQMDGRNKKSIALDLKQEDGQRIIHDLAAACDVFITNMPYSNRESFKLTYEDLKPLNPAMIYMSLTAYGEKGEERYRKAFDQLAYWARSGLMDLMREPGTRPTQGLPGMGDHPTAVAIYAGIVTALLKRERTGEGSFVETSLLANGLWSVSALAQGVMAGGDMGTYRERNDEPGYTFRVYQASDGRWLQFNMVRNEELLNRLLAAMDAIDLLLDKDFSTPQLMYQNRVALGAKMQSIVATRTSEEWLKVFKEYDVPVNLIAIVEETATDPQILENQMAVPPEASDVHQPLVLKHPVKVSGVEPVPIKRAPHLGEHSRQILQDLKYEPKRIEALFEKGVVTEPEEENP